MATGISHDAKMKPYQVVNGIAVIRIQGALIHNPVEQQQLHRIRRYQAKSGFRYAR
ncbi:hypothetical protein [Vibrio cortegadensis]|uniref:hypothetical protein n=1 Tax=Vibrio cortegadensis TaxID=1328770 RepID=UPI0021C45D6F|nr:hypothetical protein [Vibrio cortegadensis]